MIDELRSRIAANRFEFTRHALDQSILRRVTVQELREAILDGEVIEDYPKDKYGPSQLSGVWHNKIWQATAHTM